MDGVRLEFSQHGHFDSFSIYRQNTLPFNLSTLPAPIATNLKTMHFVDTDVALENTYHYVVATHRNDAVEYSDPVSILVTSYNVIAHLHFDDNFNDLSGSNWSTFGNGNVPIFSSDAKFGSAALNCNPNNSVDYCGTESAIPYISDIGTGEFTIRWWQKQRDWSYPSYQAVFCHNYNAAKGLVFVTGGSDGRFALSSGSTLICKESSAGALNEYEFRAVTRDANGVVRIWRNGTKVAEGIFTGPIGYVSKKFCIGAYASDSGATGQMLSGLIDEFQIVDECLYDSDFVPPNEPFN